MTTRALIALAALLAFAPGAAAQGDARQRAAVMLDAPDALKPAAERLGEEIAQALHETERFAPITQAEMGKLLNLEQQRQLVGCAEAACFTNLAGALAAPYFVSGSLTAPEKAGARKLALQLIELKTGTVLNRLIRDLPDDPVETRKAARAAAQILVRPLLNIAQGDLVILASETEAKVFLDDRLVGLAPVPKVPVAGGVHQLRMELEGFNPVARDIRVVPSTMNVERVDLAPSVAYISAYRSKARLWRIAGIAMTVALSITGATIYFIDRNEADKLQSDVTAFNSGPRTDAAQSADLQARRDSLHTRGLLWSTMGFVGLPLIGAGSWLWATAPDTDRYKAYEPAPAAGR